MELDARRFVRSPIATFGLMLSVFLAAADVHAECRSSSECDPGQFCEEGRCVGARCTSDTDCAPGQRCTGYFCEAAPVASNPPVASGPFVAAASAAPVFVMAVAPENTAAACSDGRDDDGDGLVDCADPECGLFVFCRDGAQTSASRRRVFSHALVTFGLGARTLDAYGGYINAGLALGGGAAFFTIDARFAAAVGASSGNQFYIPSADMGLRVIGRSPRISPTLLLAVGYGHITEREGSRTYLYHWPHGRLGLGLMWGRGHRFNMGIEVDVVAGYAVHYNAHTLSDGSSSGNYSGFWLGLESGLVATF